MRKQFHRVVDTTTDKIVIIQPDGRTLEIDDARSITLQDGGVIQVEHNNGGVSLFAPTAYTCILIQPLEDETDGGDNVRN